MSTIDFRISSAQLGARTRIVSLGGEIDLHTAPQLNDALESAVADGATRVIVDFEGVSFIDSTVLGVLLRTFSRLRSSGGELVLVSDDRRILRTFEITGLDRKFRIESSLAEAMHSLVDGGGR